MTIPQPSAPAAGFATILRCLTQAVVNMMGGNRLAGPVITLIVTRIREIKQRFARLAERIAAGTYKPRRYHGRKPAAPRPRRQSPLPTKFGWLLPMVYDAVSFRAQLEGLLFRDPAMAELMAAAPASMARILRPLCWMLRLEPPPILVRPRVRAAPSPAQTPPRSRRSPPPKARPAPAAPAAQTARPKRPAPRACGPPRPA